MPDLTLSNPLRTANNKFLGIIISEPSAVQNPMLRYVGAIGWTYISPDEAQLLKSDKRIDKIAQAVKSVYPAL